MARPLVTLTTDFGTADGYAGAVKGVLASLAPTVRVADLSHSVAPHDVSGAAWLLLRAAPYFPPETIHLVIVDPGVGSARRGLVLELGGQFFVGPDNGIFSLLPQGFAGPWRGVALDRARIPAPGCTSAVFEGRDLFAPAAAALANALEERATGAPRTLPLDLEPFGYPIGDWVRLPWIEPRQEDDEWVGEICRIDRFGNALLNLKPEHGPGPVLVKGRLIERGRTYADVPPHEPLVLEGSTGFLEIAINQEPASRRMGLAVGDPVRLLAPASLAAAGARERRLGGERRPGERHPGERRPGARRLGTPREGA